MLEIKEFRCYEVKIEESEKAGSHWESTQDTCGLSRQCSATEPRQPDNYQPSQSSCTGGTEYLPLSVVRTLLEVDQKILSIRKEPLLSVFLSL